MHFLNLFPKFFLLIGFSVWLSACGGSGGGGGDDDTLPTVSSSIADGSSSVSRINDLTVTFSEDLDPATVNDTNVVMTASARAPSAAARPSSSNVPIVSFINLVRS